MGVDERSSNMTPEQWERIKEIFEAALRRPPDERSAYIERARAGDRALRQEVASLLAAHERADRFLEEPAVSRTWEREPEVTGLSLVGRRLGAYRVIRELSRGGMGTVYLAVRADEVYRKRVALKVVNPGMHTDDILRRFGQERQILASLDHPNIARLLDGGATEDGRPYFVMEYIEGEPITQYCDQRRLSIRARLRLFQQVCAAVQYAHQNLIVHRDLKPSNILVTTEGVPKLLDFGIAKILNPELTGVSSMTTTMTLAVRPMTPEYASPEQVRGGPVTTASDVYSLGVLLYELLTGHRPYRLTGHQPEEMCRIITETELERPSTVIDRRDEQRPADAHLPPQSTADRRPPTNEQPTIEVISRQRDTTPQRLKQQLKGDLDNIVLMALRKEPTRRYVSVEQFAQDIKRYLDRRPVLARKDTLTYRTGKFIRRHMVGVMAALFVILSLVGGLAIAIWQARVAEAERARAERRFNDVHELANFLLFELHDAIRGLPGSTPVRQRLVERALEYLDSLSKEAEGDLALQEDLAMAYERVGDIQGNPNLSNLGDMTAALQSYRRALKIRQALLSVEPTNVEWQRHTARTLQRIGDILWWSGDTPGALESYQRALRIHQDL